MFSVKIKNLRSLKDTKKLDIKPLTLLVGENSSGKSTFLRIFPLFRQSIEARTSGPLLWWGRFVDFGSFSNSIYSKSEEKSIYFSFEFSLSGALKPGIRYFPLWEGWIFRRPRHSMNFNINVEVKISEGEDDQTAYVEQLLLKFKGQNVLIQIDNHESVNKVIINDCDFSDKFKHLSIVNNSGIIPEFTFQSEDSTPRKSIKDYEMLPFYSESIATLQKYIHRNTSPRTTFRLLESIELGSSEGMLKSIQNPRFGTKTWRAKTSKWTVDNPSFLELQNLLIAKSFLNLLTDSRTIFSDIMAQSNYIAPVRATAERYYRQQNLAIDEIDYKGQNIAM
ncbi:MAG: AAA family ATPase, partial [Chloroflexota bacterium]